MTDWGWGDEMAGIGFTQYLVRAWDINGNRRRNWFYADLLEAAACYDRACEEYHRAHLKDLVTNELIKCHATKETHDTSHQP